MRIRFQMALVVLVILLPGVASSAQKLVTAQSEIAFVSKQMGVPVQGRFERFDGRLNVDPAKPEAGTVSFTVDLGSAAVGTDETVVELKKPEWFDVAKYPQATFQSTSIKSSGGGRIDVVGKLTIKGIAREIHVPMVLTTTRTPQGDTLQAAGEFVVKRLDYKIGAGEWGDTSLVADDVLVRPRLTVTGVPTP
jgi:polyisoprenoid-binding protein YceI